MLGGLELGSGAMSLIWPKYLGVQSKWRESQVELGQITKSSVEVGWIGSRVVQIAELDE